GARRDVEHEGAVAGVDVAGDRLGDGRVTADEIRAERLVVLERHQPVGIWLRLPLAPGAELRELAVPHGVRRLHGKLVGELALAIRREALVRIAPRLGLGVARDQADAQSARWAAPARRRALRDRLRIFDR